MMNKMDHMNMQNFLRNGTVFRQMQIARQESYMLANHSCFHDCEQL